MKDFEKWLDDKLKELPYTKHADDGQYNDGRLTGFEEGARELLKVIKSGVLHSVSNSKSDTNTQEGDLDTEYWQRWRGCL